MSKATNAGINAGTGFEFQKHCALFIYLNRYSEDINKSFFICIEHHDDFLFAYLNDTNVLEYIEIYQAKKNTSKWELNEKLIEPISKILGAVDEVKKDEIKKIEKYQAILYFITNAYIELKKKSLKKIINETNSILPFSDLDAGLKDEIRSKIIAFDSSSEVKELDKLHFQYIDFGKTYQSQLDQLVGQFSRLFGSRVHDHKAAIQTLLSVFREVELTFNQGDISHLLDEKKRITSEKLSTCMSIITMRQMAFELWRKYATQIASSFKIPIKEHREFELSLQSSFDLFKDKTQVQHQRIKEFVFKNNSVLETNNTDPEAINDLANRYIKENFGSLPELHLRAAIIAAYIEMKVQDA